MSTNPLYNLTWGEYGTSLISAVQLLRCHDELVDVTLAAGGKTFHAHKLVLCAASPFLLDLLKSTTCKHPVVMLAGVQASDLEALLEFVYRGEVSIDPTQLPSLLQAAHCLNIQGLSPSSSSQEHELKNEKPQPVLMMQTNTGGLRGEEQGEAQFKRRKRAKRLRSPPNVKIYMQGEGDGNGDENGNGNGNVMMDSAQQVAATSPTWAQQMNLVNVSSASSALESLPIQLVQNIPLGQNSTPKIRGASDQPGACPLCGAMLRQARNLRRHLLTSCKYRMVNGQPSTTNSAPQQIERTTDGGQMHQLQTISMQNMDRVNQNIEDKPMTLTPITCGELLPPSSNIITMQSATLQ